MKNPAQLLNRMLNRAAVRFRGSRPGSILILVVALLVLMALIGTAFISTARIDRYSATQNTYNTQVDLLIQGVLAMADGPITRKVEGNSGTFRVAVSAAQAPVAGQYNPWESPITDLYLADRVPTNINGAPGWGNITSPANATTVLPTGNFESPYAIDSGNNAVIGPVTWYQRTNLIPASISITQADGTVRVYPAFSGITATAVTASGMLSSVYTTAGAAVFPLTVLAADTDGDGIADAGYIRIPMGQLKGATYYGALRIIDNLAAINASIAMEPFNTGVTQQTSNLAVGGDFFPANIDLKDMLVSPDTLATLNGYRFNSGSGENFSAQPVDDFGVSHKDFQFNTAYEAAWTQLGSRLNNPGYNTTSAHYQAVPIDEGMNLAYHGGLANIYAPAPSPVLETYLPNSVYGPTVKVAPFSPSATGLWFSNLYNYDSGGAAGTTLRPILVVRNPLSSFVPSYSMVTFPPSPWAAGTAYAFGNSVQVTDPNTANAAMPGGNLRGFVCINPLSGATVAPMTGNAYNNAVWAAMPWASAPTKINANTGTFGQLWTAYWSVMQDSPDASGNTPAKLDTNVQQFRNVIRNGGTLLTRSQMIQLRAALAAVNTIDMRDGDEDVTSRTVALTAANGAVVYANVYGAEKQPYITEVMVSYEPTNPVPATPYVAIELYNPHPTPIPLTNWKLASMQGTPITLTEVGDLTKTLSSATPPHPLYINPGERIVLQSQAAPQSLSTYWASQTPTVNPITVQSATGATNLGAVVPNELVLLRPRLASGSLKSNGAPENTYSEDGNLYDLVPLDNIDLSGIPPYTPATPPATPTPQRYRYARADLITNDANSAAWHCVYPGPYSLSGFPAVGAVPAKPYHMWGIVQVNATTNPDNGEFGQRKGKFTGTQPSMQTGGPYAYATYDTRPLQINNRDSAGPNRPYTDMGSGSVQIASQPMNLPLGGFARRGDLLQVPFIGAYRITTAPDSGNTLVMNSVTMDSVYAQFQPTSYTSPLATSYDIDTSLGVPFHNEQIGHFCPMDVPLTTGGLPGGDFLDDPGDSGFAGFVSGWTYHWAKRLFDYLDVRTPQDAYFPNVDPAVTITGGSGDPSITNPTILNAGLNAPKYPANTPLPVSGDPNVPVLPNTSYQQLQGRLDTAATEGMININTANWKVLSAVPWFTPGEKQPLGGYAADNAVIAQDLVNWRDTANAAYANAPHTDYGPFRSIFDIMKVPAYKSLFNNYWITHPSGTVGEVTNQYGDLSPFMPTFPTLGAEKPASPGEGDLTDHVFGGVKTRFLGLIRISNLITTRSDSFTVYAQVQGWQNVGTTVPTLVATRRAAAFLDRSQVVPQRKASTPGIVTIAPMGVINVPND